MGHANLLDVLKRFSIFLACCLACLATPLPMDAVSQELFDTVIQVNGKLKDVRRNLMTITRDDGVDVTVMLHEDPTRTVFNAVAKPQWLQQGMIVRVESMFGPTGSPPTPIKKVELLRPFQPSKNSPAQRERYLPGIYPLDEVKVGQQVGFRTGNYRVIGTIMGMDATGVMVNTGQTPVPLPIAPDAEWSIVFHDLSLAQAGDPVSVNGFHQPPDETKIKAGSVRITTDRIYGEVKENERGKRRTPRSKLKDGSKPETPPDAESPADAAAKKPE